MAIPLPPRISRHHNPHKLGLHGLEISRYFAAEIKPVMKQYKIIPLILTFLTAGNVSAADLDTLKVVDVEEGLVIAAPKENRKLREQPTAVTLLSQQDMQAAQEAKTQDSENADVQQKQQEKDTYYKEHVNTVNETIARAQERIAKMLQELQTEVE